MVSYEISFFLLQIKKRSQSESFLKILRQMYNTIQRNQQGEKKKIYSSECFYSSDYMTKKKQVVVICFGVK
jgi:hypothetical protein